MMLNRCAFESTDLDAACELYSTSIQQFPASLRPLEKQKFGKIWPKMAKRCGAGEFFFLGDPKPRKKRPPQPPLDSHLGDL